MEIEEQVDKVYDIIVVIPTLNEEAGIGSTINSIKDSLEGKFRFQIFKIDFLHEKLICFIPNFFVDKIWLSTFDCARFQNDSSNLKVGKSINCIADKKVQGMEH